MSSCFYNASGTMDGADVHDYYASVEGVPVPIKAFHIVCADFVDPCEDNSARLGNVTSDAKPMIQGDFKLVRVGPHAPIPMAPPHPVAEPAQLLTIFLTSGSVALLAVATVTGVGKPLACCVHAAIGTNLNCCDPIDLPLDIVINENTVLTQPTGADFARAALDFSVSGLISKLVGAAFDKIIGKALKRMLREMIIPLRKKAEDIVKNFLEDIAKELKDPIKSPPKAKAALASLGVTHV